MSEHKRKWGLWSWVLVGGEVLLVLLVLRWFLMEQRDEAPEAPVEGAALAPAEADRAAEEVAEAAPEEARAPAFDLVRVEPSGSALVAGRAEAGSSVAVLVDGAEAARAQVGADGAFSLFLDVAPDAEPRQLSLRMEQAGGDSVASDATVILAPAEMPATDRGTASELAAPLAEPAPDVPDATAPAVLLSDAGGVRLLQAPERDLPPGGAGVLIEAISYDAAGDVVLSGRGAAGRALRLYLDNAAIAEARIDDGGRWQRRLEGVAEGVYTLRADLLKPDGSVAARFETPFQREPAAQIAATAARSAGEGVAASVVTVQPGYTLWGIADRAYGSGVQYVKIFRANAELIRDPDLIYPGQVFALPAE